MRIIDSGLHAELIAQQASRSSDELNDIQETLLHPSFSDHDCIIAAEHGSGKSYGVLLNILNHILTVPCDPGNGPRCIILTPTRERANYLLNLAREIAGTIKFKSGLVVGGSPYPIQQRLLRRPLDILIAMPSRLIDHVQRGRVNFTRLSKLVIDEGQRMVDLGVAAEIQAIVEAMPKRHTICTSSIALSEPLQELFRPITDDANLVESERLSDAIGGLKFLAYNADSVDHKQKILSRLLGQSEPNVATVVFTNSKRSGEEQQQRLEESGVSCELLHREMKNDHQEKIIQKLRNGNLSTLVITDGALQEIKYLDNIHRLVHFDLPRSAADYLLRLQQTANGGVSLPVISLVGPQDWSTATRVERLLNTKFERQVLEGLEPSVKSSRNNHPSRRRAGRQNSKPNNETRARKPNHENQARRSNHESQARRPNNESQARKPHLSTAAMHQNQVQESGNYKTSSLGNTTSNYKARPNRNQNARGAKRKNPAFGTSFPMQFGGGNQRSERDDSPQIAYSASAPNSDGRVNQRSGKQPVITTKKRKTKLINHDNDQDYVSQT